MSKKNKLPVANQSIRTRTLIYFMVMALSMITLLWAVQEWFFSTQYATLKQKEIVKTLDSMTQKVKRPYDKDDPDYFGTLGDEAKKGNLKIYFFAFKKTTISSNGVVAYEIDDNEYLKLSGNMFDERVISPLIDKQDFNRSTDNQTDDLGWTPIQQHRFIKLLGLDKSFNEIDNHSYIYDKEEGRLYYAAEAGRENYVGEITHFYFYIESPITNSDYTLDIMRFEFVLLAAICLLLAFVFSVLLASFLARPLTKISKQAERLAKGDYSVEFGQNGIKEIDKLTRTLDFAAKEFSQTESIRREFLANISHDLRTPLTMVKAYAEMIRDLSGNNPEKRNQHAQVIIDEANRLSLLVADIQKLSKLQAGTDTVNKADFDLNELCAATTRQFAVMHEKFGYNLSYRAVCGGDRESAEGTVGKCTVNADRDKISQVLYNLIGNAINYTNKQDKLINIRLIRRGGEALVEIEDNGKGIAPEDLDAVWSRYYRANQVKRAVVGSGLGLSIVKNILVAHEATYGVKSELGKGTIFWFSLPIVDDKRAKTEKTDKPE